VHIIAVSWWRIDEKTKTYVAQKKTEGHSNPEISPAWHARSGTPERPDLARQKGRILRCLKRYIAREIYYVVKHEAAFTQTR